ncbi:MAG: hypothetical protein WKF96_02080 [Solirubrobacteraceae bacterium]
MSDPFDSVFGSERGSGLPAPEDQTPLTVARQLVADLNAPGPDTVVGWSLNYIEDLTIAASKRGLTLLPPYDLGRNDDFEGFCLPVAASPQDPPFAVLRLNRKQQGDDKYAELWRLDAS